jgi:hypothetical protein
MPFSASASEMTAFSAVPALSSAFPITSFRRCLLLTSLPPAVDVPSASEPSERTLTALAVPSFVFTPPGFTMPRLHPQDSTRLADLHRCYSCASMRHSSMLFPIYDAHVLSDLAPLHSQSRLLAPLSRDAPRAHTASQKFPVCVFCRRDLLRNHSPPPIPPRRQPGELTPDWEPDPDRPGDCESLDDSDDLDDDDNETHL